MKMAIIKYLIFQNYIISNNSKIKALTHFTSLFMTKIREIQLKVGAKEREGGYRRTEGENREERKEI